MYKTPYSYPKIDIQYTVLLFDCKLMYVCLLLKIDILKFKKKKKKNITKKRAFSIRIICKDILNSTPQMTRHEIYEIPPDVSNRQYSIFIYLTLECNRLSSLKSWSFYSDRWLTIFHAILKFIFFFVNYCRFIMYSIHKQGYTHQIYVNWHGNVIIKINNKMYLKDLNVDLWQMYW